MFLYFLDKNNVLFVDVNKKIEDSTLVALTIMIAESRPEEKEIISGLFRKERNMDISIVMALFEHVKRYGNFE